MPRSLVRLLVACAAFAAGDDGGDGDLCSFWVPHLAKFFASGSCFDAEFPRSQCCPTDPEVAVMERCFFGKGGPFRGLTPEVCCHGDLTRLYVPEPGDELSKLVHAHCGGAASAESVGLALIRFIVGQHAAYGPQREWGLGWRKTLNSHIPLFGLLLRAIEVLQSRMVDGNYSAPSGAWPPPLLSIPELPEPRFDPALLAPNAASEERSLGWLQLAWELFDEKDGGRWEAMIHRAQEEHLAALGAIVPSRSHLHVLDQLWTQVSPPTRWRQVDLRRGTTWRRLWDVVPTVAEMGRQKAEAMATPEFPSVSAHGGPRGSGTAPLPEFAKGFILFSEDEGSNLSEPMRRGCAHLDTSIMRELRAQAGKGRNFTVLDVGAGTAPCKELWRALGPHVRYFTHDFAGYSESLYSFPRDLARKEAGSGITAQAYASSMREKGGYVELDYVSDITELPLANGTVDIVVCTQVLEHVPAPDAALREMLRVLRRPGGKLFLSIPYGPFLHNLPFHFNGGMTHEWFRHHIGSSAGDGNNASSAAGVANWWWNYFWEPVGTSMSRGLNGLRPCFSAIPDFVPADLLHELLGNILPQLLDAKSTVCPHLSERRPLGLHVVAEMR